MQIRIGKAANMGQRFLESILSIGLTTIEVDPAILRVDNSLAMQMEKEELRCLFLML